MEKEQLRPVEYNSYYPDKKQGYFHKWIIRKEDGENGSEYAVAIIETEDGKVIDVREANGIRFLDR